MSLLNKKLRGLVLSNDPPGKERQIKILRFQLKTCQRNMDKLVGQMKSGELVDMGSLDFGQDQMSLGLSFSDSYVQNIALKYPAMAQKFKGIKILDKILLEKKLNPTALQEQASSKSKPVVGAKDLSPPKQPSHRLENLQNYARKKYGEESLANVQANPQLQKKLAMEMILESVQGNMSEEKIMMNNQLYLGHELQALSSDTQYSQYDRMLSMRKKAMEQFEREQRKQQIEYARDKLEHLELLERKSLLI